MVLHYYTKTLARFWIVNPENISLTIKKTHSFRLTYFPNILIEHIQWVLVTLQIHQIHKNILVCYQPKILKCFLNFSWYTGRLTLCFRLWLWKFSFKLLEMLFKILSLILSSVGKLFWYLSCFVLVTCLGLCSFQTSDI